jgi:hypothetical protein
MDTSYSIIRSDHSSWTVDHDGDVGGEYATKEAAFEAAAAAASNAIKDGLGVTITVPAPAPGESALGSR